MKAIVLAGGEGNCLDPLTKDRPKWLLPIFNRPLIEHLIVSLQKSGITEVALAMMPGAAELAYQYLGDGGRFSVRICYIQEKRQQGTAGCLRAFQEFIGHEPFWVVNSNLFLPVLELSKLVREHIVRQSIATVGVFRDHSLKQPSYVEEVEIAPDGTVKKFHLLHPSRDRRRSSRFYGIYLFDSGILDFIDLKGYMDIKEQLIPRLIERSLSIHTVEMQNEGYRIDGIADYVQLHQKILADGHWRVHRYKAIEDQVYAGAGVRISPKAHLLGPVILGDYCTIEQDAYIIGPCIMGDGCYISKGALVRESVVWNRSYIQEMARLEHCVVGEDCTIPKQERLKVSVVMKEGLSIGDVNLLGTNGSLDNGTGKLTYITFDYRMKSTFWGAAKRVMDIVLSSLGLVLGLPLFILIAIAVKLDSPGPLFYSQRRCGKDGREFRMIKFRTMAQDADSLQQKLYTQKDVDGPVFKLYNDPRITRVGRLLRATSLDELPQLINVLKGEMSLVGPRPLAMEEMRFNPAWRDLRLKVKPGITGLWQINGRSSTGFHDWIRYDNYYVKNQSLWLDLKILLKTIGVVLKRLGAY
jgi:lipopolysaccharide/colanic/teichoic acid biosynthesis glycosyltransferase/NDP-sugar pyrophosphorylase family protein